MITGLNHIGIAVRSIDDALRRMRVLGVEERERIPFPASGQISALVRFAGHELELMEPCSTEGTVAKYLISHGEGLHHLSLRTDSFDEDIAAFEAAGLKVFGIKQIGGRKLCFIHPKSTNGILFEVMEAEK